MENKEEIQKKVKEVLENLFAELNIETNLSFEVLGQEGEDERLYVDIEAGDDKNLLIGYHGEVLNSIQHILNILLFKNFVEPANVVIDIAGYRKEREQKLEDLAESVAEKAKFIKKGVALYPMNSYERKIIHNKIGKIEGVTSSSDGEGLNRRVIISPIDE